MGKLTDLLKKNKMTLIASLPDNSPELAKAALNGGAQALKVHINIKHKASGVSFGSLAEEGAKLDSILDIASKVPVGIVPGDAARLPDEKELREIIKMGFDFYDMNLDDIPEHLRTAKGISRIAAVNNKHSLESISTLKGKYDAIEAGIIPQLGYGQTMTIGDLRCYISIAIASDLPVIVPTQRKISVEEVPILADTGIRSIMIGAIVTGRTPQMLEQATRCFRNAIDQL